MTHELPPLPYDRDALAPHISKETIEYHYGKHHQGYVDKLNKAIAGTEFADADLETIVRRATGKIFNFAGQIWNHNFYWDSMSPNGGGAPGGALAQRIDTDFGSLKALQEKFNTAATGQFGSGWAWLVQRPNGTLAVRATSNAETPLTGDDTPLLTCDVWEHAYYIDRRNARAEYVDAWWELVNWEFAAHNANLD